jgi:hypothetical protein
MAGADLLNGGTGTAVSQLSEARQGIMCAKEGIGKYGMWYGVVCKAVMSCTSAVFSLAGGHDTVPCLAITAMITANLARGTGTVETAN